ncbi:MAG: FAD/NAD(P)-binding protein, partial [Candidatus Aminicenantes bacterium]
PARIVRTYHLTEDVKFFQVRIVDMEKALSFRYRAGQFAMISVQGAGEAPFSISSTPSRPGLLEFCIRKAGTVTNALFRLKENDLIGLRGPYGNEFPVDRMKDKDILIVVGGLGAAPLRSVLLYCLDNRDQFSRVSVLHGAKRPAEMIFREEFFALKEREDLECLLAVDEDDTGKWTENIGVVTTLFPKLKEIDPANTFALVCGPPVMYKFVINEFIKLSIPKDQILMTLERRMKCGVGKCGHCAIDYIYTCIDGPVFTYWDVIHMKELI